MPNYLLLLITIPGMLKHLQQLNQLTFLYFYVIDYNTFDRLIKIIFLLQKVLYKLMNLA